MLPLDGDRRIQDWMLQKGNIVIPMNNITTHSVYMLLQLVPRTYTKDNPGGKTSLQAYEALVFHLSNEYSHGDAYWVCFRLGQILKRD